MLESPGGHDVSPGFLSFRCRGKCVFSGRIERDPGGVAKCLIGHRPLTQTANANFIRNGSV